MKTFRQSHAMFLLNSVYNIITIIKNMNKLYWPFFSKYNCFKSNPQKLKMAPSSGPNLHQAFVKICPYSFKEWSCDCPDGQPDSGFHLVNTFWEGRPKRLPLYKSPQKKSHGVESGERGGKLTMASSASEARPIQRLGRRSLRRALTSQALRLC